MRRMRFFKKRASLRWHKSGFHGRTEEEGRLTQWEEESDWGRGERLDFGVLGSGRDTNLECMIKKEDRGVTNLSGGRSTAR